MYIVITGVTRGLGRALADWYIANGHTVAGCGRNGQEIFDLRFAHPEPHRFEPLDVTQANKVMIWAEKVLGGGVPDLLINNAAVMNDPAPLWQVPAEKFAQLINVNIVGVANVIRAFVPAMVERKRGRDRQFQLRLGPQRVAGSRALLRLEMGDRGPHQGPGRGAARRDGGGAAQSGRHRHRDAAPVPGPTGRPPIPTPEEWAETAAPFILKLGPKDNGESRSVGD